jgi:hypothetical protein
MKRVTSAALLFAVLSAAATANAQAPLARNQTPERVTVYAEAGGMFPVGRFGDVADAGFAPTVGGYYFVNDYVAPAFRIGWAFLKPNRDVTGPGGSLDMANALLGVRLSVPVKARVHPWVNVLGGVAHYESYRGLAFEPVLEAGSTRRTDPLFAFGGGLDVDLHPNFSLGFDAQALFSISTASGHGERSLTAVSIGGMALLHY